MKASQFCRTVALLALTVAGGNATAQQPSAGASGTHGAISGVVLDSLRGGLLAGAVVVVEGSGRSAVTDSAGAFLVDSVPVGERRVVLLDGILDTLSLSIVSPNIRVAAGDTVFLIMSLPSAETIVRAKCGAGPPQGGRAALVGMVVDAETEKRVAGASIVLAWSEVQASREIGLRTIPMQRSTRTLEDGSFRICGLSDEIRGELIAWSGPDTTAALPFSFAYPVLAIRTLALPSGSAQIDGGDASRAVAAADSGSMQPAAPRGRRGGARISGRVVTPSGSPIVGARVSLAGAEGFALTNERGEFVLSSQPAGSQSVVVRRLGYEPAEFAMNLSPARPVEVEVELPEFVPVLSPVIVTAQLDDALDRVGFSRRKRAGFGRYMTLEEIEQRGALHIVDLLAGFPMLRSVSSGTDRRITGRPRGVQPGCVSFFVDGIPWIGGDSPADFLHPQEIGAVEAYTAGSTPAEFSRSLSSCETVLLWTRHRLGSGR